MLNKKVVLFWAIVTPVILIALTIIALFVLFLTKIKINDFVAMQYGFSGFFANLVVLISALQYLCVKNKTPEISSPGNPTA